MSWLKNQYLRDVRKAMQQQPPEFATLKEADLARLPPPVQRYLKLTGVPGQEIPRNMRVVLEGQMRNRKRDWFRFRSEQYNFFTEPARYFFMKAAIGGLPVHGYHSYMEHSARMRIRLAGLLPLVNLGDARLFAAETVTFLNDLCLFAPAALVDPRIVWEPLDASSATATFPNKDARISAILYFNEKGYLSNFESRDRFDVNEKGFFPFTTPVSDYQTYSNLTLPGYGEGVWHYPAGEFVYGRFWVRDIQYNLKGLQAMPG